MKIIFLGPPGVGKGTYASRISPKLNIPHISTGDLLRGEVKAESELGKKAKEYMDKGELVPDELVIKMLKKRISKDDAKNGFILDGFPRTIPQAEALDKEIKIDTVINFIQKDHILIEKISARRTCKNCGEIYNLADIHEGDLHMPPMLPKKEGICDKCGGKLIQRDDDKEEVVRGRLEIYKKQTAPLIEYYEKKGLLKNIEVTGGPDKVVPEIMEVLGK